MLDKNKVFKELQTVIPKLYSHYQEELKVARFIWNKIINNQDLANYIKTLNSSKIIPKWSDDLANISSFNTNAKSQDSKSLPYGLLAVDGSQIYPDRHQGINCYLLNIGTVEFIYKEHNSEVELNSFPTLYTLDQEQIEDFNQDNISCKRAEHEFKALYEYGLKLKEKTNGSPFLLLCDGSLIFWHLEHKYPEIKQRYLVSYLTLLEQLYKARLPIAGYISMPKSKELINILRIAIGHRLIAVENYTGNLDYIVDTDILSNFLHEYTSTILFENKAPITQSYPEHLKPYFLYLNLKSEIARIEIPAWIAHDKKLVTVIIEIILDQCKKGDGYPIGLAEAHEQAVVKNTDRDFFYYMLNKVSSNSNQKYNFSQKSLKKRLVGI